MEETVATVIAVIIAVLADCTARATPSAPGPADSATALIRRLRSPLSRPTSSGSKTLVPSSRPWTSPISACYSTVGEAPRSTSTSPRRNSASRLVSTIG